MGERTIAVVDDEKDILDLLTHHLKRAGFKVRSFFNGKDFLLYMQGAHPDIVILDIMLPGVDGLEICKILKRSTRTASVPIIMLTAKGTEADIVLGLELGADDYMVKPFSPGELVARVKMIFRRMSELNADANAVTVGPITIDSEGYEVTVEGKKLSLTTTEFKILEALSKSPGKVFTRDVLIKQKRLWGDEKLIYDRTIDVHIKNLREKLGEAGKMIETIRGVGYKLQT